MLHSTTEHWKDRYISVEWQREEINLKKKSLLWECVSGNMPTGLLYINTDFKIPTIPKLKGGELFSVWAIAGQTDGRQLSSLPGTCQAINDIRKSGLNLNQTSVSLNLYLPYSKIAHTGTTQASTWTHTWSSLQYYSLCLSFRERLNDIIHPPLSAHGRMENFWLVHGTWLL